MGAGKEVWRLITFNVIILDLEQGMRQRNLAFSFFLPASIFNYISLVIPACDPKRLVAVLLKQGHPWPCTSRSNTAEQFINRPRIWPRLLLCRGLMQVFCPLPASFTCCPPALPEKSRSCSLAFCPFPAQETLVNSEFPLSGTPHFTCTAYKTDSWTSIGQNDPEVGGI